MAISEELLELEDTPTVGVHSGAPPDRLRLRIVDLTAGEMGNSDDPLTVRTTGLNPTRHGNWAQWAAVAVATLIGLFSIYLTVSSRNAEKATKAFDEHMGTLINAKLDPAIAGVTANIATQLAPINAQLSALTQQIGQLQGRFQQLDTGQKKIAGRLTQEEALNRLQDPRRILATIRAEIEMAKARNGTLPTSQLADYRSALHALPSSAADYWTTVAAIINYQSLLNQMRGEAPDPFKVARPCIQANSPHITIEESTFRGCVHHLDNNDLRDVTFQDSVIQYQGGPVSLSNVRFINCRFVLELADQPITPAQEKVLLALLDSPDQKTIQVP